MGAQFPFFVADMDFGNPGWPALAVRVQRAMRGRRERFGIIFIGEPTDTSDAMWSRPRLTLAADVQRLVVDDVAWTLNVLVGHDNAHGASAGVSGVLATSGSLRLHPLRLSFLERKSPLG